MVSSAIVDTLGSGHGALAGFLKAYAVDAVICGGLGGGARMALTEAGIGLYAGVTGRADEAVQALLAVLLFVLAVVLAVKGVKTIVATAKRNAA